MLETENKFEYLPGLIDKTRKARIEAERRLLRLDTLAKHACIYYACIATILSLSTVFFDYKGLPFLSLASAIVVTICTVYASSQNYGVRAEQMRQCYLDLQRIRLEFDHKRVLEEAEAQELANNLGERYIEIVQRTENHLSRDYRLATGQVEQLANSLRWSSIRACVYAAPVVVGIAFSLAVWPI